MQTGTGTRVIMHWWMDGWLEFNVVAVNYTKLWFSDSLKQNEAQSARAESTHKGVISTRKTSHKRNNKDPSRLR